MCCKFAVASKKKVFIHLDSQLFHRVILIVVLFIIVASEIYGINDTCIKKLESFQRSLYRKALKLSKSTSSVMIYEETGTTSLHITI